MSGKYNVVLLILAVAVCRNNASAEPDAVFRVTPTVIQSNPPLQGFNAYRRPVWNAHGRSETFEPAVDRRKIWAKGFSNNTIRVDMIHGTYYNTLRSGYYNGYRARIYRWDTNALHYALIRTDTVSVHRARTYNDFTEAEIRVSGAASKTVLRAANTDFVDVGRDTTTGKRTRRYWPLQHGTGYWYMVTAVDESGNESEPSPFYDFSVPHPEASVTASTNTTVTNLYITTFTLPDASAGELYDEDLLSTGGTGPVTWTKTAGTLPPGLSITNDGGDWLLYGTPSSVDPDGFTFTLQVSDGTHSATRELCLNLPDLAGDPGDEDRPAPPTGLTATALNGMTYLTWDANSEPDLAGYRLYRSKASRTNGDHVAELVLAGSGPDIRPEDEIWLENDFRAVVDPECMADEKYNTVFNGYGLPSEWVAAITWTTQKSGADIHTRIDTNHPAVGRGSLKVVSGSSDRARIYQYGFGEPGHWWYPLQTNHTYRMRLWLRQDGSIPSASADIYMGNVYLNSTGPGLTNGIYTATGLTTNWQLVSYDFTTPAGYPTRQANINIEFDGPGALWIDQVDLFDPVSEVGRARPDMLARLQKGAVGSVRTMGGAEYTEGSRAGLDNYLCDWQERAPDWSVDYGFRALSQCTLPVMLQLAEDVQAQNFYVAGSKTWTLEEWEGFFDYLGGTNPANPYVARRTAQRGTDTPWTDEFETIYVSFENEQFWAGADLTDHTRYARWAEYFFGHIISNSPVYRADPDKFTLIISGWDSQISNIFSICTSAEGYEIAGYGGGREEGDIAGHYETFNDTGLRSLLSALYTDPAQKRGTDEVAATINRFAQQSGRRLVLTSYENGGSYSVPGLHTIPGSGVGDGPIWERYGKSKAFAVSHMAYRLYRAKAGWVSQNYFDFTAGDKWSSHAYVPNGGNPHPHWAAAQMYNNTVRGPMLGVSALKVPTDVFSPDTNDAQQDITVPLVDAYCRQQSNTCSIILLSRRLDTPGVDDGVTSVALEVPFTNAASVTKWYLTGDPRTNNIGSLSNHTPAVVITNQFLAVDDVLSNRTVTVDLAPAAMEIYVFEGAQDAPAEPVSVVVNQAVDQSDPTEEVPLHFLAAFSEPVNGFTVSDLNFGGTAPVDYALIEEVPQSGGLEYSVQVFPLETGTVTLDIPAGAVTGTLSSTASTASESFDNHISVSELPIVEFDLDIEPIGLTNSATALSSKLQSAILEISSGVSYYEMLTNCIRLNWFHTNATVDDAVLGRDYFSVRLTPDPANGVTLSRMRINHYSLHDGLWIFVRASTDGFQTFTELTDYSGSEGSYANPVFKTRDLHYAAPTGTPVELRFYLTGLGRPYTMDYYIGKNGHVDGVVDLRLTGRVDSRPALSSDWDSDGLPNEWEAQHFGGSTTAADPTHTASNGVNTVEETYIAGLNPTNSRSVFTVSGLQAQSAQNILGWTAQSGRVYSVYWASNLLSGFERVASNLTAGAYTDALHQAESQGFYRIDVEKAP